MEPPGVLPADDDGESVVKAQRLRHHKLKAPGIFAPDAFIDLLGITRGRLLEDGGQRRARVLDVKVNSTRENRLLADVSSRQVEAPVHGQVGFGFDVLGEQFSQHHLFGEVLGADHDAVFANSTAARQNGTAEQHE